VSKSMQLTRLDHIGLCVNDMDDACSRFERYFGLVARDFAGDESLAIREAHIPFRNRCTLQFLESRDPSTRAGRFLRERGEGLEHIAMQTRDLERDVAALRDRGVRILDDRVHRFDDGLAAFVHPDELPGMTVQLVEFG